MGPGIYILSRCFVRVAGTTLRRLWVPALEITCSQLLGFLTFLGQRQRMRGGDCWLGQDWVQGWPSFSLLRPDSVSQART